MKLFRVKYTCEKGVICVSRIKAASAKDAKNIVIEKYGAIKILEVSESK